MNEEFDEEGTDETSDTVAEIVAPDLVHRIAGIDVGFKRPVRGQLVALSRVRDHVSRELRRAQQDSTLTPQEKYSKASRLIMDVDLAILNLVESLMVNESDKAYVANALLTGEADMSDISDVLFGNVPEVDDDADPVTVTTAKKPARKAAARKVANAKRTKV